MFKNKTILITGGTGSFGTAFINELVKKYCPPQAQATGWWAEGNSGQPVE